MAKIIWLFLLLIPIACLIPDSLSGHATIEEETIDLRPGHRYYNSRYRDNCVKYVRWLTDGKLPLGLHGIKDKKHIIRVNKPGEGWVAIIHKRGASGHVAYVAEVEIAQGLIRLTLLDTVSRRKTIRKRTITGRGVDLDAIHKFAHIIGYWHP